MVLFASIALLLLPEPTKALTILHDLPTPLEFIYEAGAAREQGLTYSHTRAELAKVNGALTAFSHIPIADQRKAMHQLILESQSKLPILLAEDAAPHERRFAELDCYKLDLICIAKGVPPGIDRRAIQLTWQPSTVWPTIDVTSRFHPRSHAHWLPYEPLHNPGPWEWAKAAKLVSLGYYDLPARRVKRSAIDSLYAMPSPAGFRREAYDARTSLAQIGALNEALIEFSGYPVSEQRAALLKLVEEGSDLMPWLDTGHYDFTVEEFDFTKFDFIAIAKGEPPRLNPPSMTTIWYREPEWPSLAENPARFPKVEAPGLQPPYESYINKGDEALARRLVVEGYYDLRRQ